MEIKIGDKLTIVGCYFQVPDWTEGQPCVILSPTIYYDEVSSIDNLIEDYMEDIVVFGNTVESNIDFVEDSLKWAGTSLNAIKRRVKKALKTDEKMFENKYSKIVVLEVEFIADERGDMWYKEINKRIV